MSVVASVDTDSSKNLKCKNVHEFGNKTESAYLSHTKYSQYLQLATPICYLQTQV